MLTTHTRMAGQGTTGERLSRRQTMGLVAGGLFAGLLGARPGAALAAATAPAIQKTAKVGASLYEVVFSTTTGLVHVASAGQRGANDAAILGLDPQTLELRATLALPTEPAFGLAVNDRTGTLYTTNTPSGSVSAIDLKSGRVVATMVRGERGHVRQVVVDEEGNRAFVSLPGMRGAASTIWVIDGARNEIVDVLEDGLVEGVSALTLDRAGNRLFAASLTTNEVVEVSLATRAVVRRFASGGEGSINIAFDAAGNRILVANQKSGTLTVLDAASGTVTRSIATGEGALGVTLNPANGIIYVANRGAGTVSVIDGRSLEVLASLPTGTHPNTVAIDRRSGLAYVTNKGRSGGRGAAPVEDPNGDTVSIIRV
ncbi:MAG: hypothetical protein JWP20_2688 [Roseomonas sp.]|nr:hypothetical protein [Roseomonas sp.]